MRLLANVGTVGRPGVVGVVTADEAVEAAEVPTAFVAVTVNVYAFPAVKPDRTIGDDAPVFVTVVPPDAVPVTVNDVTALPPSEAGTVNATATLDVLGSTRPVTPVSVAAGDVGAPGVIAGVTDEEAADDGDEPTAFVAVTEKV